MMKISIIKDLIMGAGKNLSENKETLNNLNVFPIPDGDTGTNMEKTLLGAVRTLVDIGERELVPEDFDRLYDGVLMAAQGNSGVILSQWFKGLFTSLSLAEELDAPTLNDAFRDASEASYNAVSTPVEGTFLTVAREAYEQAEEELTGETSLEDYLSLALAGAQDALRRTPDMLPVLKEAGVVDSGGYGFVCILSGMLSVLTGEYTPTAESFAGMLPAVSAVKEASEFGYCTELILQLDPAKANDFSADGLTAFLNEVGNSVINVRDGARVKIHVHTLTPERVLARCHEWGEFLTIKIENMTVQHHETIERQRERLAVAAVADGDGIADMFHAMGVKHIIRGGQSDNVSTEKMLECFRGINAENIILLPNNDNLLMVADQAKKLYTEIPVHVVPTESMAEGYAALSTVNLSGDVDDIMSTMERCAAHAVTGVCARATRDSVSGGIHISSGQYIGIVDGNIVAASDSEKDAILALFAAVPDIAEKESVLAICASDEKAESVKELEGELLKCCPDAEIYYVNGGQEVFDYVFAIE